MNPRAWILLAILTIAAACSPRPAREAAEAAFFRHLSELCGARFEGFSTFPTDPDHAFAGQRMVAEIASCRGNEIRIPLAVGPDRSRTWIFRLRPEGLELKHDHRHADGTPDEITMYGGLTTRPGTPYRQSFPADAHTQRLIPEASTNVWTVIVSRDGRTLKYELDRHDKPRFRATLQRVDTP